ncbi:pentapeptide repeat-containing protein [Arthrobacter sp. BHU FT2]|nr:pentapeptide repeat-containing protein [Arthrobacter sp. BHU FT2]
MNTPPGKPTSIPGQDALRPDCSNCFALCCTAFGFSRSADFAIDKPPASACPNLAADFSCTIHGSLRPRGFRGCTVFDCFGAGQAVSQGLFGGVSWRDEPGSQPAMFASFRAVKQLHEMLWHLAQAQELTYSPELAGEVQDLRARLAAAAASGTRSVLGLDMDALHGRTARLLWTVSEEARAGYGADDGGRGAFAGTGVSADDSPPLHAGADLAGARLRGRQLCGADLRNAVLIAADLRGADLTATDLLGADLRDARLDDAYLAGALFLTQAQVTSALGSAGTRLPPALSRPSHWTE